ncbi:MAG TPA: hypothetical protein VK506_07895, partial [Conexibacter sp.]|nr:hypothetical protein [Conexibacter sp.]
MRRGSVRSVSIAALVLALGVAACGGAQGPPERPAAETTPTRLPGAELFAVDSVWNAPLADDAPLDPSSPRLVAALAR